MYPEFFPIAIIAALSLLIPLPWHLRAGNIATLAIVFWLFVSNIIYAVDAAIWSDNVENAIPVWCDITTKLIIGANFALPAACLCVSIHLEQVSSMRLSQVTVMDKRRRQIIESVMCFILPIIFMALHYIVQGHRFDIIEGFGCRPTTYFSIVSIFIVWIPPLLMAAGALVFAGLALRHFMLRRLSFAASLSNSRTGLTASRYLRLMLMSVTQMVWSVIATSYAMWFTVIGIPIRPWTNWADVHSNFSRVDQYPALVVPESVLRAYYILWWVVPASTFLFVAFFAFGRDAVEEYKKCLTWMRVHVLRQSQEKGDGSKASFRSFFRISDKTVSSLHKSAPNSPSEAFGSPLPLYKSSTPDGLPNYKSSPSFAPSPSKSTFSLSYYSNHSTSIGTLSDSLLQTPVVSVPPTPYAPTQDFSNRENSSLQILTRAVSITSPRPYTYPSHDSPCRCINHLPNATSK